MDLTTVGLWPAFSVLGIAGDYTVRRIRGFLSAVSVNNGSSIVQNTISWGIYIAGKDAATASAFADPQSDPTDWMAFGTFGVELFEPGPVGTVRPWVNVEIDNKSMRKVNENHQVPVLMIMSNTGNVGNMQVNTAGRILVSHGRH